MPVPIAITGQAVDLSSREGDTAAVTASPAAAAETIIATLVLPTDVVVTHGVLLFGYAAWTVGTSGTTSTLKLRQTDTSGTTIKSTGALPTAAGVLEARTVLGLDTVPGTHGQTYVLTLTIANGAAASTVSAVELAAIIV